MTCASGSVGGARPCQGRGRGFESRLALFFIGPQVRGPLFLPLKHRVIKPDKEYLPSQATGSLCILHTSHSGKVNPQALRVPFRQGLTIPYTSLYFFLRCLPTGTHHSLPYASGPQHPHSSVYSISPLLPFPYGQEGPISCG